MGVEVKVGARWDKQSALTSGAFNTSRIAPDTEHRCQLWSSQGSQDSDLVLVYNLYPEYFSIYKNILFVK